jgi:hypothetical protein
MLAHSPPLPLIINFPNRYRDITAEEEGIILALEQRDRIRLRTPLPNLRKLIMAIDEEFPVLEYLIVSPPIEDTSMVLRLPETFQAPHLRHLVLAGFALPMGSRLLATAVGLVSGVLRRKGAVKAATFKGSRKLIFLGLNRSTASSKCSNQMHAPWSST